MSLGAVFVAGLAAGMFGPATVPSGAAGSASPVCARALPEAPLGPAYYAVDLVPTGRVPGTRNVSGSAGVTASRSPFGLAVAPDGRYRHEVEVSFVAAAPAGQRFVAWVAPSDLSERRALGPLAADGRQHGTVEWNKFIVVITLERADGDLGDRWEGPVVARGMSRSGLMHTMAGHGPFQGEPCGKYGY